MEKTINTNHNTNINSTPNIAPAITESTTLGELISILNLGKRPHGTPTPKKLRETAGEPVAMEDRIKVYRNGFAVYDNGSGRTVIWLPDCRNFTYIFVQPKESEVGIVPEKVTLPNGFLDEQPWAIAVTVIGDHRVENLCLRRKCDRKESKTLIRGDNEEGDTMEDLEESEQDYLLDGYTWRDDRINEDPLDIVIRHENQRDMLSSMTEKQKEVFLLYYDCGHKQYEIAQRIGISQAAVKHLLDKAIRKAKKYAVGGY